MATPRVLAHQGETIYLLDHGDGMGQVYDMETDTLYGESPTQNILARGYWEPIDGSLPVKLMTQITEMFD
jgi:hypothetical protein